MVNILDFNLEDLKIWMKQNGEKEFRAKQVINWIYNKIWDFNKMSNLPKSTREKLNCFFYIGIPEVVEVYESSGDDTKKILYKYRDGSVIECVEMDYNYGNSICVSTQVGCRMGCKFCASTIGGVIRNLTAGEIIAQILCTESITHKKISNVVLMGSGEPLDNYENIIKFLDIINKDYGLNIGHRHITLSTCGIVPKIYELADLNLQITLAISLHASSDEERRKTMPIANKYSIQEIIDSCKYYINKTNRRITFEYALVKNINDSIESAKKLAELLQNLLCHVNLIPVNQVTESNLKKPAKENIKKFSNILTELGINNTIRREMGSDINAACGQLRRNYMNNIEERC